MITEKIYETKGLEFSFEAKVISCQAIGNRFGVLLDRTAFFPGGGGQDCDTGAIAGTPVREVKILDGEIVHFCDAPLVPGASVFCTLDGETRRSRMEHHTGEHVLSGILHSRYGYENVGFHLGDDYVTLDTDGPLTDGDVALCEELANEAIRKNVPVEISFYQDSMLSGVEYRSKKELTGTVRLVRIGEIDTCACCAPHLETTGQIGCIYISSHVPYKGGTRMTMLAGSKAVKEIRKRTRTLKEAAEELSVKPLEVFQAVLRLKDDLAEEKNAAVSLSQDYGEQLLSRQALRKDFRLLNAPMLNARTAIQLGEKWEEGVLFYLAFTGPADAKKYIVKSRVLDLKKAAPRVNEILKGRGGGKPGEISGSSALREDELESAAETLYRALSADSSAPAEP